MSDVKKIKRNKIRKGMLEDSKTSIIDDGLRNENSDQHSNTKKSYSSNLKKKTVTKKKDLNLVENKNDKIDDKIILSEEKRAIYGEKLQRIGTRRLRGLDIHQEEKKLDREIENEDNLSIMVMIIILVLCFIVGISLGYVLYRIAMNSSNALFIITHYIH